MKGWQKKYDEGGMPPAAYFDRPEVWLHLQETYAAFFELGTERQIGMGLGPIPSSKIREYARDQLELDGEEADRFFAIVRAVDDEYITIINPKSKSDSKLEREVSADDVDGTRDLLRSVSARKKKKP